MPGTIQVTVLEFKGVSSSSKPSAKSLKVSMGKRQYQTWDKGDFSFPITKLREDLVVTLLDAGGNEIAHSDIRTMHIIEKGSWDEVFSINGGGHVHMKLQFVLSEEERDRIRIMRESAVKKKLDTNPNINIKLSETVTSTSHSVETSAKHEQKVSDSQKGFVEIDEGSQAGSSLKSATSSSISLSSYLNEVETSIPQTAIPNTTDGSQSAPSSPRKHEIRTESPQVQQSVFKTAISEKNNSVASKLQDDPIQKSHQEVPLEKPPSNVRKVISAFENSQLKDVKSQKKAQSVPSQLNIFRKEGLLEDREPKAVLRAADKTPATVSRKAGIVSCDTEPSEELALKVIHIQSGEKDSNIEEMSGTASRELTLGEPEVDLMRQSTSAAATSSGRMNEEQVSQVTRAQGSGSGRGRGTGLKSSTTINIQVKPKSLELYKEECHSAQSSGLWIFPDNTRRLCITTAGEQVMKIVGHHHNESKAYQGKKISSESQRLEKNVMHKMEKDQKKIGNLAESGVGSSPDDSSNGLARQVIKVAIIVGFGVLVLLTRQKEPRKRQRRKG